MDMGSRVPGWLTPVAWAWIAACLLTAVFLTFDIYVRRRRHRDVATELVWIASALYLGPVAAVLHHRYGRLDGGLRSPAALGGLPGGGASAVGHLLGVPLVLVSGLTIAGIDLWVMIIAIGVLAIALLLLHDLTVSAAAPTSGSSRPSRRPSLASAAVAAVLTVLAFDIGMGGWMLLLHHQELMPPASEGSFWFLMQVGILLGLATGYPVVRWAGGRQRMAATA